MPQSGKLIIKSSSDDEALAEINSISLLDLDLHDRSEHEFLSETLTEFGEDLSDTEKREFLETANHETDRLTRLVNDVLDLSRLESSRNYNLDALDIGQLIEQTTTLEDLEQLRVNYLGKKGELSQILREMGKLTPEERPRLGAIANEVKELVQSLLEYRRESLNNAQIKAKLAAETLDVTLPALSRPLGRIHPHPGK